MKVISPAKAMSMARKLGWNVIQKQNKIVYIDHGRKSYTSSVPGRRGKVPIALARRLVEDVEIAHAANTAR